MSYVSSPAVLVSSNHRGSGQQQAAAASHSFGRLTPITLKGKEAPIKYVVHEIVRILARHKRPLHTLELEKALRNLGFDGVNISTNKELFDLLANNKFIEFNTTTKRLTYKNRYESVVSQDSLLAFVVENAGLRGLKVNMELLSNNSSMASWINEILRHRKVRAVRSSLSAGKGKRKCRYAGTPNQCSLYSSNKCHECSNNVEGIVLFPLGKDVFELDRYRLDHDIKGLWDSVAVPSNDQLLSNYNIAHNVINFQPVQPEKRKRKESKGYKVKMRKIYNTHLFTPQELKDGINLQ